LVPDALVVVEEAQGVEVSQPERFKEIERRDYAWFMRSATPPDWP
jgi:16S rRNA (guanine966-N2)-methyltransferase